MLAQDRPRQLQRFMRDDMFSGWGWRTMSRDERSLIPQLPSRSIWPHDNSLIAHAWRHDFASLPTALYALSHLNFRDYRLPELFCGMSVVNTTNPYSIRFPAHPSWASGAVFLILMSVLVSVQRHRKELNSWTRRCRILEHLAFATCASVAAASARFTPVASGLPTCRH